MGQKLVSTTYTPGSSLLIKAHSPNIHAHIKTAQPPRTPTHSTHLLSNKSSQSPLSIPLGSAAATASSCRSNPAGCAPSRRASAANAPRSRSGLQAASRWWRRNQGCGVMSEAWRRGPSSMSSRTGTWCAVDSLEMGVVVCVGVGGRVCGWVSGVRAGLIKIALEV